MDLGQRGRIRRRQQQHTAAGSRSNREQTVHSHATLMGTAAAAAANRCLVLLPPPPSVDQELSADTRDWAERDTLVRGAVGKFRLALRCRPDFDRGCYNLGTVFYTAAVALQSDTGWRKGGKGGMRILSCAHDQHVHDRTAQWYSCTAPFPNRCCCFCC